MATEIWDFKKLHTSLQSNDIKSIYLIFGEDTYLIDQSIIQLKKKMGGCDPGECEYGLEHFIFPENTPQQVRDSMETLSLFNPKKFILYKLNSSIKDTDWELLTSACQNPMPSLTVVIIAEKIDKRKKYFRFFSDHGVIVECKRPYDNQLENWVDYIAKQHHIELEKNAKQVLLQYIGNNLIILDKEILKISQNLSQENRPINANEVKEIISYSYKESVFDLTHAIGSRKKIRALACLRNLKEFGQNELGISSLIARHLRLLHALQEGVDEGLTGNQLSAKAGIPPFFLTDYMTQLKKWSLKQLQDALLSLHENDRAFKSSSRTQKFKLDHFILQICH